MKPNGWGWQGGSSPASQYSRDLLGGTGEDYRPDLERLLRANAVEAAEEESTPALSVRRRGRGKKGAEPKPTVRPVPEVGSKCKLRVLALDPGANADRFGLAVVEYWDPVSLVTFATTLEKGLDQPQQIGIVVDLLRNMEAAGQGADWIIFDGRGMGFGVVGGVRKELDSKFAKTRTIDFSASSGFTTDIKKSKNDKGFHHWSLPKGSLVEMVNAEIIHGRLQLSDQLPFEDLEVLKRQFAKFQRITGAGGKIKYEAPGRGSDDVASSVLLGSLVILEKTKRGNRFSRLLHPDVEGY